MDFSSQPEELVIQQLSQLPVEDILNACQGSTRIAQICSGPILWRMKLQMDFPGVDVRINNPKEKYLELINERAKKELLQSFERVHWTIGNGVEDNLTRISEIPNDFEEPQTVLEIIERLKRPISGLHRLVIYYAVESATGYLHRVEYRTNKAITPQQVLESIEQFYDQPYTQENADTIFSITGEPSEYWLIPPGPRIVDSLHGNIFFEGLRPYKDGFKVNLGS